MSFVWCVMPSKSGCSSTYTQTHAQSNTLRDRETKPTTPSSTHQHSHLLPLLKYDDELFCVKRFHFYSTSPTVSRWEQFIWVMSDVNIFCVLLFHFIAFRLWFQHFEYFNLVVWFQLASRGSKFPFGMITPKTTKYDIKHHNTRRMTAKKKTWRKDDENEKKKISQNVFHLSNVRKMWQWFSKDRRSKTKRQPEHME